MITVLSLFDGMSCGRIALERSKVEVGNYIASEVDKYAIHVTKMNYPDTLHIGDITKINTNTLPPIDLLIGGSPCQGFSSAGKQLNFSDPRSALFFEYVRILIECKPKYFLLENVRMKKDYLNIISLYLGVEPICINSSLVSAQNRTRYYWTNIPNITQPSDRGIFLKDIFLGTKDITERYLLKKPGTTSFKKSRGSLVTLSDKSRCITTGGQNISNSGATNIIHNDRYFTLSPIESERLQTVPDNYTDYVSDTQRYKMLGNGWTIDVIAHILNSMQNKP